jgi:glycosyltransferase involved in cell wall biosynthesis
MADLLRSRHRAPIREESEAADPGRGLSVCFFARVNDRDILNRVEFYAQDIKILRELGHDVRVATKLSELRPADLYYIWWWTWAFAPLALARALRRPSVVTGVFDAWDFERRPALQKNLLKMALRRSSVNIFISQYECEQVSETFAVNAPRYSPLSVDTAVYSAGEVVRSNFIFSTAWMEGANAARKCVPELIRAVPNVCRAHPEVRFLIAGERGSAYPALAELARDLGVSDRIEFLGVISREQKIELMQRCKIYLQPSRFEGFGLAILEAMSCGAAVVSSPVGAVPEVVGDTARLVDGTSPRAIAAAVNDLLDRADERQDLGHRARARAESVFPYERRLRDIREIIEQVCRPVRLGSQRNG